MTGNIREGLALLAVAAITGILWMLFGEGLVAEIAGGATILLALIGLWRIASGLVRPEPTRD